MLHIKQFSQLFRISILLLVVSICFTFVPIRFFPFYFSAQILTYQSFKFALIKDYYFIWQALLLILFFTGSLIWNDHREHLLICYIFIVLFCISSVLSLYLIFVTLILYSTFNFIPRYFKKTFHWFYYLFITIILILILPWIITSIKPGLDTIRILMLHIIGLKACVYFYDVYHSKINHTLKQTFIYFLFPTNLFILPGWIVCPFPSDFKPHLNDEKIIKEAIKTIFTGINYLMLILSINVIYFLLTRYYLTGYAFAYDWNSFSNLPLFCLHLIRCLLVFFYYFFVANFLIGTYALFGYKVNTPIFRKPFISQNIYEFWQRALIHIRDCVLKIVFIPIFNFYQKRISSKKIVFLLTIPTAFFLQS